MRRIEADFRPRWRPGRAVLASLAVLGMFAALSIGAALWTHQRVLMLREQLRQLVEEERNHVLPQVPHLVRAYDASARVFLKERASEWAPMLRTLENGAMIGVTPTSLEFSTVDGSARVELRYADSTALLDYMARINEGVSPGAGTARWTLTETQLQPRSIASGLNSGLTGASDSIASISSSWPGSSQ